MGKIDWKQRFMRNSLSGLISTALSLACALVMFRTLYSTWSDSQFGFWALMWSLFGLGFVLDLGIGVSVQRAVAQKIGSGDIAAINRLLATAFCGFVVVVATALLVALLLRDPFLALVKTPPAEHAEFARAFTFFATALALIFPLGLFAELLHGLQRIDLFNWIKITFIAVNFAVVMAGVHLGWRFSTIVATGAAFSVAPNAAFALAALRQLPGLSVHPRHFSLPDLRSQVGFSLNAYFVSISNKLLEQGDRLVIGGALGVAPVAIYQAAAKVAEILRLFAAQLAIVVSPAAAHLSAERDTAGLRDLTLRTSRFNFLLVTPVYLLAAAYLDPLLRALTGLDAVPPSMWWLGQLLLFSTFNSQISSVCASRVLIMSGGERDLFRLTLTQAATNIALSLLLVIPGGSIGVAVATLACSLVFGWGFILPRVLHRLDLRLADFAAFHLRGALAPLGACAAALTAIMLAFPIPGSSGVFSLLWRGTAVMTPTLLFGLPLLRATWGRGSAP